MLNKRCFNIAKTALLFIVLLFAVTSTGNNRINSKAVPTKTFKLAQQPENTKESSLNNLNINKFDFDSKKAFSEEKEPTVLNTPIDNKITDQNIQQSEHPNERLAAVSRSSQNNRSSVELLPWYGKVQNIFFRGKTAKVTDIDTGLALKVKRTYGDNHADVETLTREDTVTLKEIAGGEWNWTRRAVIVEVDQYRIAASITAMPHAGRDDMPATVVVSGRSGGYGRGDNLDAVKGNGMDGHFDIHFNGSRTHSTNKIDIEHQEMVQKAFNFNK
ncbi:MAG: hypothetical protein K0R31_2501 [Clostridiales bacterium]|nr:hypothetical protein [Clostridiales bacterium]